MTFVKKVKNLPMCSEPYRTNGILSLFRSKTLKSEIMLKSYFLTPKVTFGCKSDFWVQKCENHENMRFSDFGPRKHQFDLGFYKVSCKKWKCEFPDGICKRIFPTRRFILFIFIYLEHNQNFVKIRESHFPRMASSCRYFSRAEGQNSQGADFMEILQNQYFSEIYDFGAPKSLFR